jgi:hypothetical protein
LFQKNHQASALIRCSTRTGPDMSFSDSLSASDFDAMERKVSSRKQMAIPENDIQKALPVSARHSLGPSPASQSFIETRHVAIAPCRFRLPLFTKFLGVRKKARWRTSEEESVGGVLTETVSYHTVLVKVGNKRKLAVMCGPRITIRQVIPGSCFSSYAQRSQSEDVKQNAHRVAEVKAGLRMETGEEIGDAQIDVAKARGDPRPPL